MARASRSALKLRFCGLGRPAGFVAAALGSAAIDPSCALASFSTLEVGVTALGSTETVKLSTIRLASLSSTLEAWLLTSRPNDFAFSTISLLSLPISLAISYNLFFDKSCPPILFIP